MDESDVERELQAWLRDAKKIVVAGIGNPLRRDDLVGMKIVQDIKGKVPQKVYLIECETIPESFIQEIVEFEPTHILVIDAALLGESCGSVKLMEELKNASPAVSTHALPLKIFFGYLRSVLGAKVALLAIQPKKTGYGEGLTREVAGSADNLAKILVRVLSII
jgi:hydrogenase 3 maturation protease